MKLLVTGASGRIGRALVVRLALEHQVLGLDVQPSSTAHFVGDLADAALLRRALRGVDAVLHCAALHAPQVGLRDEAEFLRVNVQATELLAREACAAGVGHLVYTSTTALYGAVPSTAPDGLDAALWLDEHTPPRPHSIYHHSKLAAEAALARWAAAGAFGLTVLRMGRCFAEPAPEMAIARLHRGIDARDVAEAHALAVATAAAATGVATQRCYVISGATPFKRADAPRLARDAAALIRERVPELAAAFDARGWSLPPRILRVSDPARAMAELGWRPRHGWTEVLAQLDAQSSEVLPPGFVPAVPRPTQDNKDFCL